MKSRKGFTLVELVIVIVIVGILSVISVPIYRGYVEKAKMVEGNVLLNAIAKAELAYHVKNDCFYSTYGPTSHDDTLDVDAGSNKYFKLFFVEANNNYNYPVGKSSVNKIARGELATPDGEVDSALIEAAYESPKGFVVVSMTVYSNGACSDIRSYTEGYGGAPEDEQVEVAEQEEYYCK